MCLLLNSVGKGNTLHINYTPRAPDQFVSYVLHQLKEQKGKQWTEQVTQVSQMLRAEAKTADWELRVSIKSQGCAGTAGCAGKVFSSISEWTGNLYLLCESNELRSENSDLCKQKQVVRRRKSKEI